MASPGTDELRELELFLEGRKAPPQGWPADGKRQFEYVLLRLERWFDCTPAMESRRCAEMYPGLAEFLVGNEEEDELVFPFLFGTQLSGHPRNSIVLISRVAHCFDWASVFFASVMVREDKTILDVGANIGTETVAFAQIVPRGRVVAIEPEARNLEWLERNTRLNALENVAIVPCAVSDRPEKIQLEGYHSGNTGLVHAVPSKKGGIEGRTLDQVYLSLERPEVSYVHIDVEGFEARVLKGGWEMIRERRPVLYLEAQSQLLARAESSPAELFRELSQLDYCVFSVQGWAGEMFEMSGDPTGVAIDENWLALPNEGNEVAGIPELAAKYRELCRCPKTFSRFLRI